MFPSLTSRLRTTSDALPDTFKLSRKRSLPSLSSLPGSAYFFAPTSTPPPETVKPDIIQGGELIVFPLSSGSSKRTGGAEGWYEGGGAADGARVRGGPKPVGLSRPKVEMARRMLSEALDEDNREDMDGDGGEYVVHLLALSMSTIRSSVPPSYLDEHPPARLALSGSSAGEGVSAEAGAAGTGGDWKEDVVQGVVGGLGWLSTSGIPTNIYHFLVFLTQAVIDLASRLKLGEMCLLLLTAVATSPHLKTLHGFLLDLIWIGVECFRRSVVVFSRADARRSQRRD